MSDAEFQIADDKQSMKHDYLAVAVMVVGLVSLGIGCHFHYVELSTASAGVVGAGTTLLIGKRGENKTQTAGGNITNQPEQA